MMSKLNPYIRIFEAAGRGVGVRLTVDECHYLAQDSSIVAVAERTKAGDESDGGGFIVTKRGFVEKPLPGAYED